MPQTSPSAPTAICFSAPGMYVQLPFAECQRKISCCALIPQMALALPTAICVSAPGTCTNWPAEESWVKTFCEESRPQTAPSAPTETCDNDTPGTISIVFCAKHGRDTAASK